ncbi:hypothetical protein [Kribbella sp. NPDC055071]
MRQTSTVPWVGLLLGMTAVVLSDPLIKANWQLVPIAVLVAGLGAYAISSALNWIPRASPSATGWLTVAVLAVAIFASQLAMASTRASELQATVMVFGPYVLLRLVTGSLDLVTSAPPASSPPLLAGIIGGVVFAAAVPLIAHAHPGLPIWTCLGIGAGLGFVEGIVSGAFLLRLVPTEVEHPDA